MAPDSVNQNAQNLRVEFLKFGKHFVVQAHLITADGAPISRLKDKDHRSSAELAQSDDLIRSALEREVPREYPCGEDCSPVSAQLPAQGIGFGCQSHNVSPCLFTLLSVGFNEPQPLVDTSGDFGEYIGSVRVVEPDCFFTSHPRLATERGQRLGHCFHMRCSIRNIQRILFKPGSQSRGAHRTFNNSSPLHDALRDHVDVVLHFLADFVEKLMQADEMRPLHIG
jgi:hypothetical protein